MSEHRLSLGPAEVHHEWDRHRPPALTIASGDVVHLDLLMGAHGQLVEQSQVGDVVWDLGTIYGLAGPIFVEGARPGQTLAVEILELTPGPWGWTATIPGFGLLPEDFPEPRLKVWDLRGRDSAELVPGVRVPIRPFLGTIGVAPAGDEPLSPFPPHSGGGNLDNRHLVAGSTLYLPVFNDGALLSCGDPHAAQGDGEVCISAIECAMTASLRISVVDRPTNVPSFIAPAAAQPAPSDRYGTMGIDADLLNGARAAVRAMVDWLVWEHGLDPYDAYILTSVAADLHIHEIVDAGVWNVGMTLPLNVFD
jgi:acetamidase/formamidase